MLLAITRRHKKTGPEKPNIEKNTRNYNKKQTSA